MSSIKTIFTNIANAIRTKKGTSDKYLPENMADEILSIETGIDTSDATATENDILLDKTAYVNGEKLTGTIPTYNNEHENGVIVEDRLKKFLDTRKSAKSLFTEYQGTSVDDLIQYSDTENVINMDYMFNSCRNLTTIPVLNTSNVTNMYCMFQSCSKLQTIPLLDTSKVKNFGGLFYYCYELQTIPQLDTSNATDMYAMFHDCSNLRTIPLLNTSNVTSMRFMFDNCKCLITIPLLDTSKVTEMNYMFSQCSKLQTIPQLDLSQVKDMSFMFAYCSSLTEISLLTISNITKMNNMFNSCSKLQTIDILKLVDDNSQFAYGCFSLTKLIIRNMDTIPKLNSNAFYACDHFLGTVRPTYNPEGLKDGRIYVPDDKVEELKSVTNWSQFADIIVGLSELEE